MLLTGEETFGGTSFRSAPAVIVSDVIGCNRFQGEKSSPWLLVDRVSHSVVSATDASKANQPEFCPNFRGKRLKLSNLSGRLCMGLKPNRQIAVVYLRNPGRHPASGERDAFANRMRSNRKFVIAVS